MTSVGTPLPAPFTGSFKSLLNRSMHQGDQTKPRGVSLSDLRDYSRYFFLLTDVESKPSLKFGIRGYRYPITLEV